MNNFSKQWFASELELPIETLTVEMEVKVIHSTIEFFKTNGTFFALPVYREFEASNKTKDPPKDNHCTSNSFSVETQMTELIFLF